MVTHALRPLRILISITQSIFVPSLTLFTESAQFGQIPELAAPLYLAKLNPKNDASFQQPNPFWQSSTRWYYQMAAGKTSLGKFLSHTSMVARCSAKYTNHCLGASTVTTLKQCRMSKTSQPLHPLHILFLNPYSCPIVLFPCLLGQLLAVL